FLHIERFDRRVEGFRGHGIDGPLRVAALVLALALALTLTLPLPLCVRAGSRLVALGGRWRRKQRRSHRADCKNCKKNVIAWHIRCLLFALPRTPSPRNGGPAP